MTSPPPILDSFVVQFAARDFEGLTTCLNPEVRLRAIIPTRLEEHHGRAAAAGGFRDWFANAERFELVERRIEPFVDRWLMTYRPPSTRGAARDASNSISSATTAPS